MDNNTPQRSWFSKRSKLIQSLIIGIPAVLLIYAAYSFNLIPGLSSSESKNVDKKLTSGDVVNDKTKTVMLEVPDIDDLELADDIQAPQMRVMNWVWFGNASLIGANGGPNTMKNSLMHQRGVNLKMITNNSVADMKREQLAFISELAGGNEQPSNGVHFVTIMGDGAPAYLSAMNKEIIEAYGEEYALKVIGMVGSSLGEDCLMGPREWKDNPQTMKGCVISTVIGDGDWVIAVRYGSSMHGIKVNPDPETYDPEAINFIPAPDDDFMKSAEDVIAGRTVELKEKDANGKLTGKNVVKKIQGSATWFPGDKKIAENTNLIKIVSTADFPNQMPTVIVGCDKWCQKNSKLVVEFLSAALTAANQIKQHEEWFNYACELAPKVFCASVDDCSETAEDWMRFAVPRDFKDKNSKIGKTMKLKNGNVVTIGMMKNQAGDDVPIGGTQMANLNDNLKYFGLKGGNNYYKSVYDYCTGILEQLNPYGFMDNVKTITPYDKAVDMQYLKRVNIESAPTQKPDYSQTRGEVIGAKDWTIEFASGSAELTASGEVALKELFDLLNATENAKVEITGHTDDQGDDASNMELSKRRAATVKKWLIQRSGNTFPTERFKLDGKGESEPKVVGTSADARKQNRRVFIRLIQ